MELSIVIPVHNEAETILPVLEALERSVRTPHQVFLVYDFDDDTTVPIARAWQRDHPNLILLRNRLAPGPANALRAGFAEATGEAVAAVMGDLSDRVEDIDELYRLFLQGYDVVCASRYMKGGGQQGGPWLKSWLSRWAGRSLYWLTGIPTRDATNSFKLYRRQLLAALPLESKVGFTISMEITVKAFALGSRITEIPTLWTERARGRSRFRVLPWLPHYLRWYFYALLRRNRLYWVRPRSLGTTPSLP